MIIITHYPSTTIKAVCPSQRKNKICRCSKPIHTILWVALTIELTLNKKFAFCLATSLDKWQKTWYKRLNQKKKCYEITETDNYNNLLSFHYNKSVLPSSQQRTRSPNKAKLSTQFFKSLWQLGWLWTKKLLFAWYLYAMHQFW